MNEFWRFQMEAGDEPSAAELLIFAAIGDFEGMGEVSANAFNASLSALPKSVKRLDIHINSPGGSVFEASAIYSRLADHPSRKVVYIDGLAASAASIVAMVGHKIYIRSNATMMVHLPSGIAMGNADDMRHMAGALDTVTESMINVYAKRTRLERDEIRSLMAEETWFSPQEAIDKGFADELRGVVKADAMAAVASFDLSRFHNVPAFSATIGGVSTMTKPKAQAEGGGETTTTKPDPKPDTKPDTDPSKGKGEGEGEGEGAGEGNGEGTGAGAGAGAGTGQSKESAAVAKERARVNALLELDRPETHAIVTAAIKDGKEPADIVKECMDAMSKGQAQSARRLDAAALDGIPASDGTDDSKNFGAKLTERMNARVKGRSPLRAVANGRN